MSEYRDADDQAAEALWNMEAARTSIWTPECWHSSPQELIADAKAMNEAAMSGAMSNAGKWSNPPLPPTRTRTL